MDMTGDWTLILQGRVANQSTV